MAHFTPTAEIDAKLDRIKACTRMYLCSAQPSTFAGIAAVSLGYYDLDSGDYSANADHTGTDGGRFTLVAAQSGNNATASGTGNHVALVIQGSSELRRVTTCPSVTVTSGQPWTSAAFKIVESAPKTAA